jgi:hypothetical protein
VDDLRGSCFGYVECISNQAIVFRTTKPTTGSLVQFPVTEAPTHLGPFYHAILFDRK